MQEKQSPPKLIFREKMGEILSGLKKKLEQRQSRTKNKKLEEFASEPHSLNAPSYEEKELPSLEQLSQQILEREDILEVLDQWTEKVSNEMRHHEREFHQDEETSGYIAYRMYAMIDTCLFSLREERLDESGNPFILCIDQVNDQDVLSDATAEERKKAVEIAIHRMVEKNLELKTVFFEQDDPESLENVEYFFAAAVSFAIITGGFDLEQAQILVEQAIRVNLGPSVTLTPTLEDAIQKICMKFLAVAYAPREPRVFKPFEDLADVISTTGLTFNLDNKDTYRSEAELGPVLDIESLLQISPLLQATHISREEMIVQARKFAYDYLGFPLGSLENARPPSHFTESKSNDNGILSREFLVYFNNYQPNLSQSDGTHRSGIVADIESQSEFRSGWFLIRLSDSSHPRITFYTKLTN